MTLTSWLDQTGVWLERPRVSVISRVVQFAVGAQLRSDEEMIVAAWLRAGYAGAVMGFES
jgi:hypothetical protein